MSNIPEILQNPLTNKDTAFTVEERKKYGLIGRLPAAVETLDQQAVRAYRQYASYAENIEKYIFLDQLHNRNEVLYYKLLTDHLAEMLPIVYDPTVGEAIKKWSRDYRRSRAVYLDINHPEAIRESLESLGLGANDVDLIVVSDAEEILGIGDWGVRIFPSANWRFTPLPQASIQRAPLPSILMLVQTTKPCSTTPPTSATATPACAANATTH